jgi:hypothetical protein
MTQSPGVRAELGVLDEALYCVGAAGGGTESAGVRVLCLSRNIPARSPSVATAGPARSHGSGSYQVDAHGPVAGGRDSAAAAVFTTGGGRCSWRASRNTREAQEERERIPLLAGQRRSGSDQHRDVGIQTDLAVIVGAPVMASRLVGLVMRGRGQV